MIALIKVYRSRGRLTFDNGVRSCRRDDPRRNPLASVVLSRGDWSRIDGDQVIVYRISKLEGITAEGLVTAAKARAWGLRLAPVRLNMRLERWGTLAEARRNRGAVAR